VINIAFALKALKKKEARNQFSLRLFIGSALNFAT
jgi:hypothetical protein